MKLLLLSAMIAAAVANSIHLDNCFTPNGGYGLMAYYDVDRSGQPDAGNSCGPLTENGGPVNWESHPVGCKFSTGVTATSNIHSDAQSHPVGTFSGTVSNGFQTFNCYKDSSPITWQTEFLICHSIYYCLS